MVQHQRERKTKLFGKKFYQKDNSNIRAKAQSAMEYLMTYGWAILIIAVVLAALDFLGVFNGNTFIGSSCLATPGYLCSNPIMTANANGPNLLSFNFEQDTGQTIYEVSFACAASSNSSTGMPNANTANVFQFATSSISSGSQLNISGMQCYGSNANLFQDNPIGTVFSGTLWIQYTTVPASTNYQYAKIAKITAKVESLSSLVSSLGAPSAPGFSGPQTTPSNILYYAPIRISNPGGPTPTSVPSGIVSYVPITITNGANVPTSAPFQQMINITESQFPNITYSNTIANFEFFTQSGTVIPTWIESNNTGKLITWVNLPTAIPASSSVTIYIGFAPKKTNLLSSSGTTGIGEAPQLSTTYAQYDDGASVFTNYWNFAGTSLPISLTTADFGGTAYTGSVSVNNGLTFSAGSDSTQVVYTTTEISTPYVFEEYTESTVIGNSADAGMGVDSGTSFSGTNFWLSRIGAATWNYWVDASSTATSDAMSQNTFYILGLTSGGTVYANTAEDASLYSASSTSAFPSPAYLIISDIDADAKQVVQWTRVRAYPPNGVMPSVTFDFPQATGTGFQQMINITESSFSSYLTYNSNFANFEYFYANGAIIPSWIESNNTGKLVTWLKLSQSIAANSNTVIYLGFAGSNNLLSSSGTSGIGEAPQLSSTYAEYDDGASVFSNYWNFAGTSLPSSLTTYGQSGATTVNNELTLTWSSSDSGLYITSGISAPQIVEVLSLSSYSTTYPTMIIGESTSTNTFIQPGWLYPSYDIDYYGGYWRPEYVSSSTTRNAVSQIVGSVKKNTVYSFVWVSTGNEIGYQNYSNFVSSSNIINTWVSTLYPYIGIDDSGSGSFSIQWARVRAYPPNGAMPSVTFGSVS